MKLEQQVCSLELSKRLRELGVKQKSVLWWVEWGDSEDVCDEEYIEFHKKIDYPRVVFCHTCLPKHGVPPKSIVTSAFTVAELIKILVEMNVPWSFDHSCKADEVADNLASKIIIMYEIGRN